ncbi:hypothetical protein [Streptomyces sp. NPDC088785]|uniref:hypothetical protein n=1 Tax=Streptomyces sp. NPDC088785 TaxID=3365897 RepID=UPI00382EB75C
MADLTARVADVTTEWTAKLLTDGLEADAHTVTLGAAERPIARIHFAFEPDMPDEMRNALVEGLAQALADVL